MARRMHTRKVTKNIVKEVVETNTTPIIKQVKEEVIKVTEVKVQDVKTETTEVKRWKAKRNKRNKKG